MGIVVLLVIGLGVLASISSLGTGSEAFNDLRRERREVRNGRRGARGRGTRERAGGVGHTASSRAAETPGARFTELGREDTQERPREDHESTRPRARSAQAEPVELPLADEVIEIGVERLPEIGRRRVRLVGVVERADFSRSGASLFLRFRDCPEACAGFRAVIRSAALTALRRDDALERFVPGASVWVEGLYHDHPLWGKQIVVQNPDKCGLLGAELDEAEETVPVSEQKVPEPAQRARTQASARQDPEGKAVSKSLLEIRCYLTRVVLEPGTIAFRCTACRIVLSSEAYAYCERQNACPSCRVDLRTSTMRFVVGEKSRPVAEEPPSADAQPGENEGLREVTLRTIGEHLGEEVILQARIHGVQWSPWSDVRSVFFDEERNWNRCVVRLVIWPNVFERLSALGRADQIRRARTIRVRGVYRRHPRWGRQIVIDDPEQLLEPVRTNVTRFEKTAGEPRRRRVRFRPLTDSTPNKSSVGRRIRWRSLDSEGS